MCFDKKAIPAVFTKSRHHNCFFHIKRKCEEKCGGSFGRIPNLHIDFSDILRNSLTIDEFENLWPAMIARYNVGHLKYMQSMWKFRDRFVPVYFKRDFFPSFILLLGVRGQMLYSKTTLALPTA